MFYTTHAFFFKGSVELNVNKRESVSVHFFGGGGGCLPLAVVLLKVCSLQNLYVTLIDLEGGAESD